MSLFGELKRRSVFRVALAYLLGSWLLLQVADVLFGVLRLPEWGLSLVAAILALGFIPAVVIAWIYELTPEGLKRDDGAAAATPLQEQTGRKLDIAIFALLLVGVAMLGWQQFGPRSEMGSGSFSPSRKEPDAIPALASTEAVRAAAEDPKPAPSSVPPEADQSALPSVAVLPFTNMSPDPDQEYFSDGLSDTLIHVLTQIDGLKVPARSSSFSFKGRQVDLGEVADQLGVAHVLEGSVQKAGDRLRIIAQLIRARDASPVWSATFDRSTEDIFAIQDEIAAEVVRALKGALLEDDSARLVQRHEPTLEAYQAFLKGRQAMETRTSERLYQARAHFEHAIELDADYALAMVNLGDVHVQLASYAGLAWSAAQAAARPLYERALDLDQELGEAYVSLGVLEAQQGDLEEGLALMRRGLGLSPGYAQGHAWYAGWLARPGKEDEALFATMQAAELDPLSGLVRQRMVLALVRTGRAAEARAVAEENLLSDPDFPLHYFAIGDLAARDGDFARQLFWLREAARLDAGNPTVQYGLCQMLFTLPDPSEARDCVESLEDRFPGHEVASAAPRLVAAMAGRFEEMAGQLPAETEYERFSISEQQAITAALYTGKYRLAVERILRVAPNLAEPKEAWDPLGSFYAVDLALALHRSGDTVEADRLLREVDTPEFVLASRYPSLDRAKIHAIRQDTSAALDALEDAIAAGWTTSWRIELLHHPAFDDLREEERFERILGTLKQHLGVIQSWLAAHPPIEGELTEAKLREIQDSVVRAES